MPPTDKLVDMVMGDQTRAVPFNRVNDFIELGWKLAGDTSLETDLGPIRVSADEAEQQISEGRASVRNPEVYSDRYREGLREGILGDQNAAAFGAGGLSALTFGAADPLLESIEEQVSGDSDVVALRAEQNPIMTGLGTATGALAGGLGGLAKSGGVRLLAGPLGAGSRAAGALGKSIGGVGGAVAEGAAEGFVFGGGQAVSNTLLYDKQLAAESIIAEMGTGALFGAGTGAVLGAVGLGLGKWAQRGAKPSEIKVLNAGFDATSDFSKAVDREVSDTMRTQSATVDATRKAVKQLENSFSDAGAGGFPKSLKFEVAEDLALAKRVFGKADTDFVKQLDAWTPENIDRKLLDVVNAQQAIQNVASKLSLDIPLVPTNLKTKISEVAATYKTPVDELAQTIEALKVPGLTDRVARIPSSELTDGLLTAWAMRQGQKLNKANAAETGKSVFSGGGSGLVSGLVDRGVGALIGGSVAGPVGALLGSQSGMAGAVRQKITSGVKSFIGAAAGSGKAVRPAVISILENSAVHLDLIPGKPPQEPVAKTGGRSKEQKVFHQRAAEIRQIAANPAATESRLRAKFAPLAHLDPEIAEAIIQNALQRAAYLNDHLPQTETNNPFNPRQRVLSSAELTKFARKLHAANDPVGALLGELNAGKLTSDTVECVKALSPEIFLQVQTEIIDSVVEDPQAIPYANRVQLSIMFDIPADETMKPDFVKRMRQNYIEREEGSGQEENYSTPNQVGSPIGVIEQPTAVQAIGLKQ